MRSRLALLALVALAGLGLSACQRDPSVAATVGSTQITEAQVDAILADANAHRVQPSPSPQNPSPAPIAPLVTNRADVVQYLLIDKLCGADQARRHFPSGQIDDIAAGENISPDSQLAQLYNRAYGCLSGELSAVDPITPTEAELRDLYDRATAAGVDLGPFETAQAGMKTDESVVSGLAAKQVLEGEAQTQNVTVSPRYRPVQVGLLFAGQNRTPVLTATIGQGTDAIES
jgi:hypothetical protein